MQMLSNFVWCVALLPVCSAKLLSLSLTPKPTIDPCASSPGSSADGVVCEVSSTDHHHSQNVVELAAVEADWANKEAIDGVSLSLTAPPGTRFNLPPDGWAALSMTVECDLHPPQGEGCGPPRMVGWSVHPNRPETFSLMDPMATQPSLRSAARSASGSILQLHLETTQQAATFDALEAVFHLSTSESGVCNRTARFTPTAMYLTVWTTRPGPVLSVLHVHNQTDAIASSPNVARPKLAPQAESARGFIRYNDVACTMRNELGITNYQFEVCEQLCRDEPLCVSFETVPPGPRCQRSTTCVQDILESYPGFITWIKARPVDSRTKAFENSDSSATLTMHVFEPNAPNIVDIREPTNPLPAFSKDNFSIGTERLGEGAFGTVYRGIDTLTGHHIAAKVADVAGNTSVLQAIMDEIRMLELLEHENIVKYHANYCVEGRFVVMVMEWCSGGSLAHQLKQFKVLPPALRHLYAKQILVGVGFLHQHSVIHRDIKPDNILLTSKGVCKVSDFGTAMLGAGIIELAGTPAYMPPDCLAADYKPTVGWDVWSLAITLWETCAPRPIPFTHTMRPLQMLEHVAQFTQQDWPVAKPDAMEEPLYNLLVKMLAVDAAQRPSCDELLSDKYFDSVQEHVDDV
eukprot:NODE_617_length_2009_cov_36.799681_g573_i0.p1 GENE.NODE_617_length_2009_cov_36.799681_g573_i0~~NODE_617_length_2009_cov_36.799681_g573_i0.p1  ORF type:complete len:639 (-),score=129.13 NODE_617_length_2009_cov_36.799681_g573_i0:93-1988(-)